MDNQELVAQLVANARQARLNLSTIPRSRWTPVSTRSRRLWRSRQRSWPGRPSRRPSGRSAAKIEKNAGSPAGIHHALDGKKSVGIIGYDEENKLALVAKPKGHYVLRRPLHQPQRHRHLQRGLRPQGPQRAHRGAPSPREEVHPAHRPDHERRAGRPGRLKNLLQCIEEPSIECTQLLMQASDVIIATGGAAMVRSAYSSGHRLRRGPWQRTDHHRQGLQL